MTQPTITTKLVRAGVTLAQGPVVPIADDGTTIELTLPAGTELGAANLQIQVPDDSDPQDLRAASTIVSSAGAWTPATDLTWLSLDWGARRGLVKLTVTFPDKTGPTHLRLRIADAGPWILATPAALVERAKDAVSVSVQLPGLAASRILIEIPGWRESWPQEIISSAMKPKGLFVSILRTARRSGNSRCRCLIASLLVVMASKRSAISVSPQFGFPTETL